MFAFKQNEDPLTCVNDKEWFLAFFEKNAICVVSTLTVYNIMINGPENRLFIASRKFFKVITNQNLSRCAESIIP